MLMPIDTDFSYMGITLGVTTAAIVILIKL